MKKQDKKRFSLSLGNPLLKFEKKVERRFARAYSRITDLMTETSMTFPFGSTRMRILS